MELQQEETRLLVCLVFLPWGREQVSLQLCGRKKKEAVHLNTEGNKLAATRYTQNRPCKPLYFFSSLLESKKANWGQQAILHHPRSQRLPQDTVWNYGEMPLEEHENMSTTVMPQHIFSREFIGCSLSGGKQESILSTRVEKQSLISILNNLCYTNCEELQCSLGNRRPFTDLFWNPLT